ncbi:WXG100 family type VII secretion target [Mycobacterium sp. LTG2003]
MGHAASGGGRVGQPVEVVTSELHSAAARLADAGQRLQDGLSSVDLEVGQLLGSGWQGGAASAYQTEWDKWHTGAGQVVRGLQTMSELLRRAADEYARTDHQAADAVRSSFQPGNAAGPGSSPAGPSPTGQTAVDAMSDRGVADTAASMNLAQPVAETGGQVAQGLAQTAGQMAGGLAQAAVGLAQVATGVAQGVVGLAQQAAQTQSDRDETGEQPDAEKRDHDGQERVDESDERDYDADGHGGAAASDDSASTAPVHAPPVEPRPTTRAVGRSDG